MERLLARYTNSYLSYVILFFFYDLAFALFSALISVYLIGKGYSASQVSLLISVASLANMVTQPIIGNLTERFGMRPVNMVLFGASCLAAGLFVIAPNFAIIVIAYAITRCRRAPSPSLAGWPCSFRPSIIQSAI